MLKTPGGLICVTAVNEDGKLHDVHISGDFFFYPAGELPELERSLEGVQTNCCAITQKVAQFYAPQKVESPGVQPEDFAHVLVPTST